MSTTVKMQVYNITRADLVRRLRSFPAIFSGRKRDEYGVGLLFRSAILLDTYDRIFQAFMAKSEGGTDEFGDQWKPLSPQTIANRPVSGARLRYMGLGGKRERGLLTPAENRQWKGIFRSTVMRLLRQAVPIGEAKQTAARLAWAILKSKGAKTRLGTLGRRKVPILRDTDRLVDSLSPGKISGTEYVPFTDDQVAEFQGRQIRIGTTVPYADKQHKTRRLWPTQANMSKWTQKSVSKARDVVLSYIRNRGIPNS